jgi:hypothetical protein
MPIPKTVVTLPPSQSTRQAFQDMRSARRAALAHAITEAEGLATTAARLAGALQEALEVGTVPALGPQLNYITGAHARLLKDCGVIEHLIRQQPKGG